MLLFFLVHAAAALEPYVTLSASNAKGKKKWEAGRTAMSLTRQLLYHKVTRLFLPQWQHNNPPELPTLESTGSGSSKAVHTTPLENFARHQKS